MTPMTFASPERCSFLRPANPERNWLYVTSVNRYLLIYTGEKWEDIGFNFNYLNKCGWCILGFSAPFIQVLQGLTKIDKEK